MDALRDLGAHEIGVTNTEVAKKLGLDKSAASRRVKTAIHKGYVKNLEDKKGRPACLVLGDPLPDEVEVLPLPKSLASDTGCNNGATTYVAENEDINPDGCRVAEFPEGIGNSSDDSAREVFTI